MPTAVDYFPLTRGQDHEDAPYRGRRRGSEGASGSARPFPWAIDPGGSTGLAPSLRPAPGVPAGTESIQDRFLVGQASSSSSVVTTPLTRTPTRTPTKTVATGGQLFPRPPLFSGELSSQELPKLPLLPQVVPGHGQTAFVGKPPSTVSTPGSFQKSPPSVPELTVASEWVLPSVEPIRTRAEVKAAWRAEQEQRLRRPRRRSADHEDSPTALLSRVSSRRTGRLSAKIPDAPTDLPSAVPTDETITIRRVARRRIEQTQPVSRGRSRVTAVAAAAAVSLVGVGAALARSAPTDSTAPAETLEAGTQALSIDTVQGRRLAEASGSPSVGLFQSVGLLGGDRGTFRMKGVSRAQERGAVSGCSGKVPTTKFRNGQMPDSQLCALPFAPSHRLRADAAVRLIRLNDFYKATFGEDICLTDSYRSLSSQFSVAARKPGLAAKPGTSEHGWGLAIDICDGPDQVNSSRRAWFLKNAPAFGWNNPTWARPGGSRPEPWHWEFTEGV